jgi:hypothetical protein
LLVSPEVWEFIKRPRTRYVLAWLLAVVTVGSVFICAWFTWHNSKRNDFRPPWAGFEDIDADRPFGGNGGHTTIDFGGQWLMGRLLVEGQGRRLYNRNVIRRVLTEAYPRADEDPTSPDDGQRRMGDVESLMDWLGGQDDPLTVASMVAPLAAGDGLQASLFVAAASDSVDDDAGKWNGRQLWDQERLAEAVADRGGPLYPPVNAFVNYPLGLLRPSTAYRVQQLWHVVLTLLAGLAVSILTRGRAWWPVAITAVAIFPGYLASIQLGQNALLTATILLWGWVLLTKDRPVLAGIAWGLLVFKPVWAVAFLLVPLFTRRWRMGLAMAGTAGLLALATVPVVGIHCWLDWFKVGRQGARWYDVDANWINLSRDLLGIPRRWLLDFNIQPLEDRDKGKWYVAVIGWGLLGLVMATTAALALVRRSEARQLSGPAAAFILFGAWMSCFHFMYYDVLLAALPLCLLFTEPAQYLVRRYVAVARLPQLPAEVSTYFRPGIACQSAPNSFDLAAGVRSVWVMNSVIPTLAIFLLVTAYVFPFFGAHHAGPPWSTFTIMALWLWCGWRLARSEA